MRRISFVLLMLAASCGRSAPPAARGLPAGASASTNASTVPSLVTAPLSASPSPHDASLQPLVITLTGPGEVALETNDGSVRVATAARLEQRTDDGSFVTAEHDPSFQLVTSCDAIAAPCVEITRGTTLRPPPFTGPLCNSQCGLGCRGTAGYGPITLRLAVSACEGGATLVSPTFDYPPFTQAASVDRRWAATAMLSAVAVRLDPPEARWDAKAARREAFVAGFAARGGTLRSLDASDRAALADALQDPKGYDDLTAKRCAMRHLIGFRVKRTLPTTATAPKEQEIEIAIDFACQKVFVVRGEVAPRKVHASHFDPSRAAFMALARTIFRDDPEIAALR